MTYGWEKQQAETAKNEALKKKGEDDRKAGSYANSGQHASSTDHTTYMKGYNGS